MRKFLRKQKGFTLVEILIAVGILAILAAIAVPTTAHFTSSSKTKSATAELANVQTALDAMMADLDLDAVAAIVLANATNDMGAFPSAGNRLNGHASNGNYIRQTNTKHNYYVTTDGMVSQIIVQ